MGRSEDQPNLDCLRAFAVCSVVLTHLLWFFRHTRAGPFDLALLGNWAVLLFFVHTSLVLMFSLERQGGAFWPFMIRRVFRIFPASAVTTVAIYCLALPMVYSQAPGPDFTAATPQLYAVLSNLLLIQDITKSELAQSVLWSLPYETQMYLLLPGLYLLVRSRPKLLPLVWVASIAFALTARSVSAHASIPYLPWGLAQFVPCFLCGVVAYRVSNSCERSLPVWLLPLLIGGTTLAYLVIALHRERSIAWSACLLVGLVLPRIRDVQNRWIRSIAASIAKYSYGAYLTHTFAIWLAFNELERLPMLARWGIFAVVLVALPVLSYALIERPMTRLGRAFSAQMISVKRTTSSTSESATPLTVELPGCDASRPLYPGRSHI